MPLLHILILALIQGITEFLPVSSSGHLVLAGAFLNHGSMEAWEQHMLLDVAVHVGTLFSVLLYFRADVVKMFLGLKSWACGDFSAEGSRLNINVLVGSLPVIAAGFALHVWQPTWLLAVEIVAWTTLIFGIVLWLADRVPQRDKAVRDMGWGDALLIGIAQILALVPGTSRSGITMTAARFLGYSRTESAHYSLLLAMVAISGAGVLGGKDLLEADNLQMTYDVFLAMGLAFVSGWAAIALMMRWLERTSFVPFAVYRIVLGLVLLGVIYAGWL